MKTLLLTSSGRFVLPELINFLPKPPQEIKLAHVITATKAETRPEKLESINSRPDYLNKESLALAETGFQIQEVDIEGKNEKQLREILTGQDVIYVQGGNTFFLLKCVRESGFDKVIKELIEKDIVYVGVSAGSYICCPTIEMAIWNDPERPRFGLTDLRAMNLVPFLLSVHYNREKYRQGLKEGIAGSKFPVRILTDDQAFLIRDGQVELVGSGEEALIS